MSCQYAKTFLAIPAQKYSMLFFLPYSVFLPPTPGGLHRRTYQSSVPENQCNAQIQYALAQIETITADNFLPS